MDVVEALLQRRSVRRFRPDPVPREWLHRILSAAAMAPTARNVQPWEFVVLTRPDTRQRLAELADNGRFIADAPVCVVVACRDTKYYLEDGAAAVVNLLTAVHGLGLGACWVAGDKKSYAPEVLKIIGAPADWRLVALVPLGFPAQAPSCPTKRDVVEMIHWERAGGH